jgi:hypothetical protein
MANENTASTEDSTARGPHENEWSVSQNAYEGAVWPKAVSEKSAEARGDREEAWLNLEYWSALP